MIPWKIALSYQLITIDSQIKYQKILVSHDGSEMSDKALSHAAYLSKISGAEIVVLNVIEFSDRLYQDS